ncbi:MAG: OB-fold nucleic acid binding domain-containing protein, partial [Fusobacteria bacterium]|nr:OB-fold nucleic acid binding domain-containing protein [Fusobacteriota bacterium]
MSTLREESIKRIERFKELGVNPYGYRFHKEIEIAPLRKEGAGDRVYSTAGRLKGVRIMGKNIFLELEDTSGTIQCYIKEDEVGEKQYEIAKMLRIGDWLGVVGNLFLTKTEELTLRVNTFELCGVNIQPLPDKHSGLTNEVIKIRQRYLDFAVNADVRDKILQVGKLLQYFRQYFYDLGYLEVETPMLHGVASGAAAKPFITHLNALNQDMYMRISPELYLK